MTRHIHADLMIQAANDTSIEWQYKSPELNNWSDCVDGIPAWNPKSEYRQKPTPHPHQSLMDQAKADPSIEWEWRHENSKWHSCFSAPSWEEYFEYRQKPVPHPHQAMMDIAKADPSIQWQVLNPISRKWMLAGKYFMKNSQYRQTPKMVDLYQWAIRFDIDSPVFGSDEYAETEKEILSIWTNHEVLCRIEGSKISVEVSQ